MFQILWLSLVIIGILSINLVFLDVSMVLGGAGLRFSMIVICSLFNMVSGIKSLLSLAPVSIWGCNIWCLLFLVGALCLPVIFLSATKYGAMHYFLVLQRAAEKG